MASSSFITVCRISALLCCIVIFSFSDVKRHTADDDSWCAKPLRSGLEKLKEIKTSRPWFKVYDVGHHTYAIDEPYNWEETIAYLIVGQQQALLLDTGMGLDSIQLVVKELTKLPVWVINSHTHNDHIGGNFAFDHILAMNTAYTRKNAADGYKHNEVQAEVSPESFCLSRLPNTDTAHYFIRPFKASRLIDPGYKIALGRRDIQVIATPGHTPDAICLYDEKAGYLWCGDSFYQGPIYLFADSTDLSAYHTSINTMAALARRCRYVLPAHNLPLADPELVMDAAAEFNRIVNGEKKAVPQADSTLLYDCGRFSYKIGRRFMWQLTPSRSSQIQ